MRAAHFRAAPGHRLAWASLLAGAFLLAAAGAFLWAEAPAPIPAHSPQAADTAYFAGGCFWCMEPPFDVVEGVRSTTSGFMGGSVANPTYQQVTSGRTGHVEVVRVIFDPGTVDYDTLLRIFWVNVDPLDAGGQFCDRGEIYTSAIFAQGAHQLEAAQRSVGELRQSGRFQAPVVTRIREAGDFWEAEAYHQDYYRKNPVRYRVYRTACGRDRRLRELWGDEAGAILLTRVTP
jgi:peptide-methionine (S)-S-oxide reductase